MYFSDYLESNLAEVRSWVEDEEGAFCWDEFIIGALKRERPQTEITEEAVRARKALVRHKLTGYIRCDIFDEDILEADTEFDLLSTNFVAESVSPNKSTVADVIKRFRGVLKPTGYLVMTGLLEAHYGMSPIEDSRRHI